ncbi:MAG: DinB family protein [Acidobacteria bacterium]|nr:DinB family protein [Acidobacteriota bacterium]
MEFAVERSIELLSSTPGTLRAWLVGLSDEWTVSAGDRDEWQPYDIVGHLIHADETDWIPRARVILAQGKDRRFPPFDRFGQFERQQGRPLSVLLDEFAAVRKRCIDELTGWNLTPEQFDLSGVHPEFGEVSLKQLLSTWVVHDLTHIRQIATAMARRYETAVGPWKAYLSILN